MTLKLIAHLSPEYEQMIALRQAGLLQPIGVPFFYIKPQQESSDFLIGAFEVQKLIGCCVLTPRGEQRLQLRQMVVDTSFRAKGIGAVIVAFAEQTALQNGYTLIYMHARNAVIPFYLKCGYHITGTEFFEVGLGHHRMEKKLIMGAKN